MTFKDNINRLCQLRGTNLTTLIKDCGYSTSKVTAINKGQIPTEEQLITLAKALDCSVMDFFSDETVDYVVNADNEETILIKGYRKLPKSKQLQLLSYYYAMIEDNK